MSFIGAVASSVRQVLATYASGIEGTVLLIGAGNFTVASVLRSGGFQGRIKCCDVSLYSSALGAYLAGHDFAVSEKADCPEQLRGLLCLDTPEDMVATIALLYDLREVWQCKNPYQVRIVEQYRQKWPELVDQTKMKLQVYKEHIGALEYAAQDGFEFLAGHDSSCTVFAFPPTYKAGYERLEKLLRAALDWNPPEYRQMTDKDMSLYQEISRFAAYFVVLEKDLPEVQALIGEPVAILPRGRASFSHIIARQPTRQIVLRNQTRSEDVGPIWPPDRPVTGSETISFSPIRLGQSIRLNELFLSSRIDYFSGGVGVSLAFLMDGQVFGKVDFCPSTHQWKLPDARPMIYIMSDLAVPSCEKRLAKLVLMCLLSREVREVLALKYTEHFGWAVTTAFSLHPVSMKYRGLFKLHKRTEKDDGYLLNYYAEFGEHKLSQVIDIWSKKHNKRS